MASENKDIFFSVVIPSYNRIEGLKNCLQSLAAQTYKIFEVIVIDDNSPAAVSDFIKKENYAFDLTIIRNQSNLGPAGSRNKGISASKYDWIAFLDDDDEWTAGKLETVANAVRKNPRADFIYHNSLIKMINEKTEYITKRESPDNYFRSMLVKNIIGGTSMIIIKKTLTEKSGAFDEDLSALEDYELWLRFSRIFTPVYIDQPLTVYYYKTAVKSISKNINNNIKALNKIRKKYEKDYAGLSKKESMANREWEYSMLAHKCLLNYQRINCMKFYFRAYTVNKKIKFLIISIISLIYPKLLFKLR